MSPDLDDAVGAAVLADPGLAVEPGDEVRLGDARYRVAEVLDTGLGAAVLADIAAAQRILQRPDHALALIGMAVEDPWASWRRWLNRLMPGFAAGLPLPDAMPVTGFFDTDPDQPWRITPIAAERPSAAFARAVLFNLGALGMLALLVAWFLIYQVGVIWLRRQQLLLARLHAIGVSRQRLRREFLALFAALGAGATAAGLALGILLAEALVRLSAPGLGESGVTPGWGAALDGWVLGKAVGSGLGVCLIGGIAAFSLGVSAQGGDRGDPGDGARSPWPGRVTVLVLLVAAAAGIVAQRSGVFGGFLAIMAMSLLAVLAVGPALNLLRRAVGRLPLGLVWRLALRDVAWHPRVLRVALAGLTLAVATGIGIGLMVESFRADFTRMLDSRLAGDLFVYRAERDFASLDRWLRDQPGVTAVSRYGTVRTRIQGLPVELGYARFDAAESARYGFPRPLRPGEALLNERLARDLGVAPGTAVDVDGGRVMVAGTFPGFGEPAGRLLVDVATLEQLNLPPRFDRMTIDLRPGTDLAENLSRAFPDIEVESRAALRAQSLRIFDRTFAITQALTLLALVVAVVGIYNALTALRLNQAPTTRLLHAQGLSAGEARAISVIRSAAVGGIAGLLALPLGIAMAWTLCAVVNPRSFGWSVELNLPLAAWLLPALLGIAAALLAGAVPAPSERGALEDAT